MDKVKRETSRAAILPFAGDPFLLNYWLELFYRVWSDEVDHLYIICDTCIEPKVLEYIEFLCTQDPDKVTYIYNPNKEQHGDKILRGLLACKEKHVMLIEDDAYIFKSGMVDWCFKQLESGEYDIVGSKRGSCHPAISERAKEIWGIPTDGLGDQGCNFWPCFFFSTKELLLQTDQNYNSRAWLKGEIIPELNEYEVAVEVVAGDTFVNTSLQLHAMVPERRIMYVPQYHAHPDDLKHYESRSGHTPFDGRAHWTHIGSLSSGVDGALMDDRNRSLSRRLLDPDGGPTTLPEAWCHTNSEMEVMEWERRVQWWYSFYENRDLDEIPEFAELYRQALEQIIVQYKLNRKRIMQRRQVYKQAFNL